MVSTSLLHNLPHPCFLPLPFSFLMKLGRMEVIHGSLPQASLPLEPWDLGLPSSSSTSMNPIFQNQSFNVDCHDLPIWVDLVDNLSESPASDTPNTDSSMQLSPDGSFRADKITNGDELQVHAENERSKGTDDYGLNLISLLFECAVAISVDNLAEAHLMLLELTEMASPYGRSSAERVVAYFAKAMASRVLNSMLGIWSPLVNYKSMHDSIQLFSNVSPFIKFAHFASNQAILEAFSRGDPVHIVDLDILQGLQWPTLLHALAMRMDDGPRHVRMTAMGTSMELLVETGKRLSDIARQLGLSFEYHPIAGKVGKVDASMVQVRGGEILAVNWVQHCLYDPTGSDWKTIGLIQQLGPKIFTLVEQEMSHGGTFLDRFVSSLHYYSAIFDSLAAYLSSDDTERSQVEHCVLHREINNILAIGGPSRSGEGKFRQWRVELRKCLMEVPMSANSMAQAQLTLNMFPNNHGYSLAQGECGALKFGWKDICLYTASAWTSSRTVHH